MALDWPNAVSITDKEGYVHTVARLSHGHVGFGYHQKDDYWLASAFVDDGIVWPDDVKMYAGIEAAKMRCETLYINNVGGWLGLDLSSELLSRILESNR